MCFKVKMPSVGLTGRDLVPQTDAPTPDSPHFGDDTSDSPLRRGKSLLMIPKGDNAANGTTPLNF